MLFCGSYCTICAFEVLTLAAGSFCPYLSVVVLTVAGVSLLINRFACNHLPQQYWKSVLTVC